MSTRRLALASACVFATAAPAAPVAAAPADGVGRSIYLRGVLGSGAPLEARREGAGRALGAAAACVNCHRRSGFGGREGRAVVPPITGRYLYRPLPKDGGDRDIPYVEGMRGEREPYTDALLARAIREGVDPQDKALSYLMPNYALGDADMASLIAYLKTLDQRRVPGVTETTLHLATVITPDADPVKRAGMLDVMRQLFSDRNMRQMVAAPRMQTARELAAAATLAAYRRARGDAVAGGVQPADAAALAWTEAARSAASADAMVLWLRAPDVAALPGSLPEGVRVYLSGLMAGLERAPLPKAWKAQARMAYPFDLPDRRRVRVDYALGWIVGRHIPLVAEQVQLDNYLALRLLSETLKHMADNFVRDFLVERMENDLAHRIITGYYPRLTLAYHQRFASKGGYVVHLGEAKSGRLVVDQDWLAP